MNQDTKLQNPLAPLAWEIAREMAHAGHHAEARALLAGPVKLHLEHLFFGITTEPIKHDMTIEFDPTVRAGRADASCAA